MAESTSEFKFKPKLLSLVNRLDKGQIPIIRLGDVTPGPVFLMKIDCEGLELHILQGWDVRIHIDHFLIEVKDYNQEFVRELMHERGYGYVHIGCRFRHLL